MRTNCASFLHSVVSLASIRNVRELAEGVSRSSCSYDRLSSSSSTCAEWIWS